MWRREFFAYQKLNTVKGAKKYEGREKWKKRRKINLQKRQASWETILSNHISNILHGVLKRKLVIKNGLPYLRN